MSKSAKARVFVPLYKVDEEQRLVYGRITAEELDQSGEVMDYASSKPNFEKWSSQIETASGGLSKGNLRVMHGLSVAGKLTDLAFDDAEQAIEVCAKVVDDAEWEKVKEGCYTGFSVGGKYGKKWKATNDNGDQITKFTAIPNEVSIVDNPCVKSATFSLVKADGAEEQIEFKKVDQVTEEPEAAETPTEETVETPEAVEKADHQTPVVGEPSASAIAEKAGELAKAAKDGSTWQDHIDDARTELMKGDTALSLAAEQAREEKKDEGSTKAETPEEGKTGEGDDDASTDPDAEPGQSEPAEKVTPPGIMQKWECSDGQTFEKKADAEAHEAELLKAKAPKTEADALRERMNKALENEEAPVEIDLFDDYDRLAKVIDVIETVRGGTFDPNVLQKGMFTVSQFSYVMSDLNRLSKRIAEEGKKEGGDESDAQVAQDIKDAIKSLGGSFKVYVSNQVDELLAGLDDEVCVAVYDYYCAAQEKSEDQLAKDVCALLEDRRESSRTKREELAKAYGLSEEPDEEPADEMTPALKKRFDDLETEKEGLKKIAEDAVSQVEELAKRVKAVEDTPLPRPPRNVALRDGDGTFLGKTANTAEEKMAVLHDMLKTEGPDALALKLIKLAQTNPQHITHRGGAGGQ